MRMSGTRYSFQVRSSQNTLFIPYGAIHFFCLNSDKSSAIQVPHDNVRLIPPYYLNGDECNVKRLQHNQMRLALPFCLNRAASFKCKSTTSGSHHSHLHSDKCSVKQMQHDNVRRVLPFHLNSEKCSVMEVQHDNVRLLQLFA